MGALFDLRRVARAMVGLAGPPANETTLIRLAENTRTESLATAGWMPVWAVTTVLGLIVGGAVHGWNTEARPVILLVSAIPLSVSGLGVALHIVRAGVVGQQMLKLSKEGGDGGLMTRVALAFSAPTPWILLVQIALGLALAVALRPQ